MPPSLETAAQGTPDRQTTLFAEDFDLLAAYNNAALFYALPKAAALTQTPANVPDFFLEFVSDQNDPNPANSLYAMLRLGLEQSGDLPAALVTMDHSHPGAALMPIAFNTGTWCHFECADAHLSSPFAWQGSRATLAARLPMLEARLLYAALAAGSLNIARAAIECSLGAVLPRLQCTVRFDPATLLPALRAALKTPGSVVPFDALVKLCDTPPPGLFQFQGDPAPGQRLLGLALAGRIRQAFGSFAPCCDILAGPAVALALPPAPPGTWDLRTPVFAETPVFLRFDPFSVILAGDLRDRLTAFTHVPAFPDQMRTRRVVIASGLPPHIVACNAIQLTLKVDKEFSLSGATFAQIVDLYPTLAADCSVDLKYKKVDAAKPYSYRLTVMTDDGETDSPWFTGTPDPSGDYLFLEASQLPLTAVTLGATPALLAQASIVAPQATLTAAQPSATLLLGAPEPAARWSVTAQNLTQLTDTRPLDLPCRSLELDLSSFPDYGPQLVQLAVSFEDGMTEATIEFAAESSTADPLILAFTPTHATAMFGYFATRLFASRYRYRAYSPQCEWPWSAWISRQTNIVIPVDRHGPNLSPEEHAS